MKGALIKRITFNDKELYQVQMVVDIINKDSLSDFKNNFSYDYAVVVNSDVQPMAHFYDPDTGVFSDMAGNRVYPPLSYDEIINKLTKDVDILTYNVNTNSLTLDELKTYLINKNKKNLEDYLYNNPMVYEHKTYTVTSDKQNQLTGVLQAYTYAKTIGIDLPLSWNETGKECVSYSFEALVMLYLKMLEYVKPIVTYQQHNEILIREATTASEALQVDINFDKYTPVDVNRSYDVTPEPEPVEETVVEDGFIPDEVND